MHPAPVAAPGASISLTPTAVTAFLLDVWPRPGIVLDPAEQPGTPSRLRTIDSEALGRQCPPGGPMPGGSMPCGSLPGGVLRGGVLPGEVLPGSWGFELRRDRRRLGGLHAMRYPLRSFLNRA